MEPSQLASTCPAPRERFLTIVESVTIFILGVAVMNFIYAASPLEPGANIGVPENDSFYHVKMAVLLPRIGLVGEFPWLQFAYFRAHGDGFVSHHVGFHALLVPFVYAAHWLTGDYLAGGRWAMATFFGLNLMLFNLLLRAGNVPWRWLWIALFLALPYQYFSRHTSVRAIGASFVFMQLLMLMLFQRRYFRAAIVLIAYVQVYLGGVPYAPLIVALYALSQAVAPRADREVPWRMVLITAAGWAVGVCMYPYFGGMWEFLWMQIFGSGLAPTTQVGQEWNPYTDPWFLVQMASVVLTVWTAALVLRLRFGPRLDARETAVLLIQFVFLLLTLKARRFIEYWPPLCLLSTAYLSTPVLRSLVEWGTARLAREPAKSRSLLVWAGLASLAIAGLVGWRWAVPASPGAERVLAEWRVWLPVVTLLLLAPLTRVWVCGARLDGHAPLRIATMPGLSAGGFVLIGLAVSLRFPHDSAARLATSGVTWFVLAAAFILAPLIALRLRAGGTAAAPISPPAAPTVAVSTVAVSTVGIVLCAVLLSGVAVGAGASQLVAAAGASRCKYDLPAVERVMDVLRGHSRPGDVVFTDDWDVFPVYFYFNSYNYYIVGLDPEFTHGRRPDLWERYVKITRGQTPALIQLRPGTPGEQPTTDRVELADIRDRFRARFVVIDRDHAAFAAKLAGAPDLAELIYPAGDYEQNRAAPYLLFRIRDAAESARFAAEHRPPVSGPVPLATLAPQRIEQGYGQLHFDLSVDGRPLRLKGRTFKSGLGTHAASKIVFAVPPGMATFEAWAGVDDETGGNGSVVAAIYLDGARVFESPVLRGGDEPLRLSIPLGGARQIMLVSEPTRDGDRFDHFDWADAKFTGAGATTTSRPAQ